MPPSRTKSRTTVWLAAKAAVTACGGGGAALGERAGRRRDGCRRRSAVAVTVSVAEPSGVVTSPSVVSVGRLLPLRRPPIVDMDEEAGGEQQDADHGDLGKRVVVELLSHTFAY